MSTYFLPSKGSMPMMQQRPQKFDKACVAQLINIEALRFSPNYRPIGRKWNSSSLFRKVVIQCNFFAMLNNEWTPLIVQHSCNISSPKSTISLHWWISLIRINYLSLPPWTSNWNFSWFPALLRLSQEKRKKIPIKSK